MFFISFFGDIKKLLPSHSIGKVEMFLYLQYYQSTTRDRLVNLGMVQLVQFIIN